MKKKPAIDEQDVALFREAASGTRLIRQDTISPVRQPVKQKARLREMRVTLGASHYFSDEFVPLLNSEGPTRYVREDVSSFEVKRLRRGDYVPDMLLDLHGLLLHLGILLLGLGSMLLSELLGLSDLVLRFLKLCGELIDLLLLTLSHDHLLLGRCQLTGQVLGLCAERVTLVLHGGKLLAKVGLTGRFGCLGGELIDLRGQTIDLPLELLVLGRQRTIAFLCLGKLGIESCDIRAKRLRGLSAGNCLLAKGFHRLGYLIEEVIDFIDVIAFLEPYGLESMLPNIFRRQQSHKSLHLALGLMPYCCCFQCSTLARNHRYFAEKRFFRGAK